MPKSGVAGAIAMPATIRCLEIEQRTPDDGDGMFEMVGPHVALRNLALRSMYLLMYLCVS
jgi:hypothetical protein